MWTDIKAIYRSAGAFARAFPLLFLIPVAVEMAQHVVEMQAGMYVDSEGVAAAETDPLRLWFGFAKTLAISLAGYWFVRFVALADPRRAGRVEWPAIGLWLVVFAIGAVLNWWALFGPDLLGPLNLQGSAATWGAVVLGVAAQALAIYLTAWMVAWPLGNARIGPIRSFGVMNGSFWYAVVLFLAGMLPLMIVHYGLAILAVVALPPALDWVAMAIDSVVVGYLALTLTGSTAYAALYAAARRGVDLAGSTNGLSERPANISLGSASK